MSLKILFDPLRFAFCQRRCLDAHCAQVKLMIAQQRLDSALRYLLPCLR
jgi:hypothetical protein